MSKQGILPLYREFKEHLKQQSKRIAPLQVISKLEEYLTKEFVSVAIHSKQKPMLPITNIGSRLAGRRIDILLADGDLNKIKENPKDKPIVRAMIEAKYLRNRHRFGSHSAMDEISATLKSLNNQLGDKGGDLDYEFIPWAPDGSIYGLVFFSVVHYAHEEKEIAGVKNNKIEDVLKKSETTFSNFNDNNRRPMLKKVYEEKNVKVLKCEYNVQLWMGLWRLKK